MNDKPGKWLYIMMAKNSQTLRSFNTTPANSQSVDARLQQTLNYIRYTRGKTGKNAVNKYGTYKTAS